MEEVFENIETEYVDMTTTHSTNTIETIFNRMFSMPFIVTIPPTSANI